MPDIHLHRQHALGLSKARIIAARWIHTVQKNFDITCTVIEGQTNDRVEFTRGGIQGHLIVAGDRFDLHAKLGFLLGAFSTKIQREIEKNLDELLSQEAV